MTPRSVARVAPLGLLLGCADRAPVEPPAAPADAADCLDYATVGAPTLTTWCTSCHSALAPDRHGAPDGVDLDTLEGARTWADRIRARAIDAQDMPYGGGIPEAERVRLQAWLDCGLPGDEVDWPSSEGGAPPDDAVDRAVSVLEDGGDLLLVVTWGGVDREVLRFRKDGAQAFWVEEAYTDADGAPTWSRSWSPPVRVWDDVDAWSETVTAVREEGGETTTRSETWSVEKGPAEVVDARLRDQDPAQVVASASTGETYTWLLSQTTSFVERRRVTTTEEDVSLGLTVPGLQTLEDFPLEAGLGWAERGYTRVSEGE